MDPSQRTLTNRKRQWAPWIVLSLALGATALATLQTASSVAIRDRERLDGQAHDVCSAIQQRIAAYEAMLRSGVGLFVASEFVTYAEFQTFVETIDLPTRYPGTRGIGFSRLAPRAQMASILEETRRHVPEVELWPSTPAPWAHCIVYIQPLDEQNRRALGYDSSSDPVRRRAMELACDSGGAVTSGPLTLVQDDESGTDRAGFLIFEPIYTAGTALTSVEDRRAQLFGFLSAALRVDEFLHGVLGADGAREIDFEIHGGPEATPDEPMYSSNGARFTHQAGLSSLGLRVPGRDWTLRYRGRNQQSGLAIDGFTLLAALIGFLLSILLFAFTSVQARARRDAEFATVEIERSGAELLQSQLRTRAVLEGAQDGVIAIDATGRILDWSGQAQAIFGWRRDEVLGSTLAEVVVPPSLRNAHRIGLDENVRTGTSRVVGSRFETRALRRDGSEFPVELSLSRVEGKDGPTFHAFVRDLTEAKRAAAEIQRLNLDLERRVEERTAELQFANRELEAFSYSVSHDLRAPLRAMNGYASILVAEQADKLEPEALQLLRGIHGNSVRLGTLIDDLLEYARLGRSALTCQPVEVTAMVQEIIAEVQQDARARNTKFVVAPLLGCVGDPLLLRIAFENLISNAVKFSRHSANACVEIGNISDVDRIHYFVRDNGVGFEMQYSARIFEVFQRLHHESEYEGTGVGLAIVQRVVQRHGGEIWCESRLGEGATFHFTVPVRSPGKLANA